MKISGNKGNAAVIVIVIFLAGIVMFIFPLMTMADKKDDVSNLQAQQIVTEYVNKWRTKGVMTAEDIDNLTSSLAATGRAYNVEYSVQVLDSNPSKKTSTPTVKIGDNVYYVLYPTQIDEMLPLTLKEGDIVSLTATTIDESIADQLKSWAYRVTGNNSSVVQDSGIVTTTVK